MAFKRAKLLWNPKVERPESFALNEDTWMVSQTLLASNSTEITFKAGSKEYALDTFAGTPTSKKTSELMLKRKYK
jgi:hypothetical protein